MSQKFKVAAIATLSYPALFEPRAYKKGVPKYSAILILPTDGVADIKAAVIAVAKERFGDKARGVLAGNSPIHGEEQSQSKGYPEGTVYINAKSEKQPGLVSRYKDPKTGKPALLSEDQATEPEGPFEMYPGCQVKAYISVYAFDADGNKGVAFGLEGLQRWDDGERLDGRIAATDLFEGEMLEEADLEDIMDESEDILDEGDPLEDIL